jgi:tetratricopeptide (TPR) repeat protein
LRKLGRYEDAIANYDKALEIKPNYHYSWDNRGNSLRKLARYEEAIASYDKAIEVKPDDHEAWNNRGNSLDDLGRYEEAIASYDKAIEIKPDKYNAWSNRGLSLKNLGRNEEAIASYDKALEIRSDYHYYWNYRGDSLTNLGLYEEAITSYNKAISISPDDSTAHKNSAFFYYKQGQTQKAYEKFEQLTQIEAEDPSNWSNAGYLLLAEEVYGSTPVFEKPLAIRPSRSSLSTTRESNQALQGRYQQSLKYLNQAITLDPVMALAWGNRSFPLYRLGNLPAALDSCDRSIQLGLSDEVNHTNRGIILLQLQRLTEAQTSFETALTIEPNYPDAHYSLACAYALQNQLTPALEYLRRAIKLNPKLRSHAQTDSDFDSIRDNKQFQALLSQP